MLTIWLSLSGLIVYLEIVYHFSGFGFEMLRLDFTVLVALGWAAAETLILQLFKEKGQKRIFSFWVWVAILWAMAQRVYLHIFKQPMLWEAIFSGGGDAVTNYWREALMGIAECIPSLILMLIPGILLEIRNRKNKFLLPEFQALRFMRSLLLTVAMICFCVIDLEIGKAFEAVDYENYSDFFDPLAVSEEMGIYPTFQRDTAASLERMFEQIRRMGKAKAEKAPKDKEVLPVTEENLPEQTEPVEKLQAEVELSEEEPVEEEEEVFIPSPQMFAIDFETLSAMADNKKQKWLADYLEKLQPTMTNEYTGIFEGYNLIFLTAEGFSPYAVREDKTPTLYHLIHTGFVFDQYYVPLWQTSTSDGEYVNCTGLIPDGQFSMKKSSANLMPYTMAGFFNRSGIQSRAYHNNTLSYYNRHITHPNLGFLFKACNLGDLNASEYGQYVFEMEGAGRWPASDYQMMISTMPEYLQDERFFAYYMTVSGHMNYNFRGNAMSSLHREDVADLDLSENGRAYIACNMELDKALEYMLEQLKEAGKLENTVIVLSADHYPYAMTAQQYEELAGKSLSEGKDLFRNSLILWNAAYEENPVEIHKACCSVDLLPTLLNLFGFKFDSRMYAGRDIFSEEEGMVIFNDRSFVTDGVIYNRKNKQTIWLTDAEGNPVIAPEEQEEYFAQKQQEVKDRYQLSAYILEENYYQEIEEARTDRE